MDTPYQKEFNKVIPIITLVAMIAVFIFSYSFIIQPHHDAPEDEIFTIGFEEISPENSYIVLESDETYSLYVDEIKVKTIDLTTVEILLENGFTLLPEKEKEG